MALWKLLIDLPKLELGILKLIQNAKNVEILWKKTTLGQLVRKLQHFWLKKNLRLQNLWYFVFKENTFQN